MGPGLRVGKEAALAVQRAKTEFINGARNGPLQIVICSPDPAGHGGTYSRSCTTIILYLKALFKKCAIEYHRQ